ncbi:hypothetical protein [Sphingomonas sp. TDK1]|uniref:hypothetical protein n=1 Tax=Sphingomonas sp. TDK1 TaxID=453247 RepID=UPI0007D99B1E|nr:hypothetical protein [Sphingomonas sp. TDK1]OAN67096.1 hypothetical protein A7X12_00225 [Sphingomonas sp. TDK1]
MQPTAFTCRAQEARQRQLATDALLPNVRDVAFIAAAAWQKEALAAEKREAREIATRLQRIEARVERAAEDRGLSENPDRGLADLPVLRALG